MKPQIFPMFPHWGLKPPPGLATTANRQVSICRAQMSHKIAQKCLFQFPGAGPILWSGARAAWNFRISRARRVNKTEDLFLRDSYLIPCKPYPKRLPRHHQYLDVLPLQHVRISYCPTNGMQVIHCQFRAFNVRNSLPKIHGGATGQGLSPTLNQNN